MDKETELEKKDIDSVDESYTVKGDKVSAEAVIRMAKEMFPDLKKLSDVHLKAAKEKILDNVKPLDEMAMDKVKHPIHGDLSWENNGGVHQIKKADKVVFSGSHEEVAGKWKAIKNQISESIDWLTESDDVEKWKQSVKDHYPEHADKIKFKVKDQAKHISAEIDGQDRSYGVYDMEKEEGHILEGADEVVSVSLSEQAKTFVKYVQEDKALEAKSMFEAMIDSKIKSAIEAKRKSTAQALFNKQ